MKKLLLIALLLTGCVSSYDLVDRDLGNSIPEGVKVVRITTDMEADSLFLFTQRQLIRAGQRIESNDDLLTITTEGTDVGQSTLARLTMYVEGNELVGRAEWMPGTGANAMAGVMLGVSTESTWEQASWSSGRPQRAFASLIEFMYDMPYQTIGYDQ